MHGSAIQGWQASAASTTACRDRSRGAQSTGDAEPKIVTLGVPTAYATWAGPLSFVRRSAVPA
jgi:hypothetical protein